MIPQNFNGVLRLEVEVPPTGLPNLVKNPNGEKGAWFWPTPVANTLMTSSGTALTGTVLTFKTNVSQAAYFTTDYMAVVAGKWVGARFDLSSITASHNVKVRFEWYDATKTLLSSSTQSAAISTVGTNYVTAVQAPASTAYVKFRFDLYNGVSNPSANATVTFNKAMVTWADTSGAIQTQRTNLVTNPSFETNISGWTYADLGTLSRDTTIGSSGTASLGITPVLNAPGAPSGAETTVAVTGGKYYAAQARVRAKVTARTARITAYWFDASGTKIGQDESMTAVATSAASWTTLSRVFTAPTAATSMTLRVQVFGMSISETHVVDAVSVVQEAAVGTYFDGTSTGTGLTYAWTGTAHASTSTETATNYGWTEPITWQNILGQSNGIEIHREELDVGTISIVARDVNLDPGVADTIRPGRDVRVTAFVGQTIGGFNDQGSWQPIFTGTIDQADVEYDLLTRNTNESAIVRITASDDIKTLAAVKRTDGVANISDLPYVLEGCGVPWNINGSGNQVASATVVMKNDNASALDQVAITRDSKLGYAWLDRQGVLNAIDRPASGNLITNGDFETATTGWSAGSNCTIARSSTVGGYTGSWALAVTKSNSTLATMTAVTPTGLSGFAVTAGKAYTLTFRSRAGSVGRKVYGQITFYNSSGTALTAVAGLATANAVGSWTLWTGSTGTAPAGAVFASVTLIVGSASSSDYAASGEVHYFDAVQVLQSADTPTVISDSTYNPNIDVTFSTARVINSVTVRWLRYKAAKNQVKEIVYGPYTNAQSISDWGARAAEFSIQGTTESASALAAFAQSVLDANSVPTSRVESVTIPITVTQFQPDVGPKKDTIPAIALLDLYSLVEITNASKGIDETTRVVGITHSITPTSWLMTLDFVSEGTVAAPQVTPSPTQSNGVTSNDPQSGNTTVTITTASTWTSQAVTFDPPFATVPQVVATYAPTGTPGNTLVVYCAVQNVTTTGFTLLAWRNTANNSAFNWVAVA